MSAGEYIRYARVAQLVEYDLAKVGAAGSSPVSRSFYICGDWKKSLFLRETHGFLKRRGDFSRFFFIARHMKHALARR